MSKTPVDQSLSNGHTPPEERARAENVSFVDEKTARLLARFQQFSKTLERQVELQALPDEALIAGIERWYSAAEVADFFGRSNQWIYDRFKKGKFTYRNGDPIIPVMTGGPKKPRMRFNLDLIKALADSCYRDGIVKRPELQLIMKRVAVSEFGEVVGDDV
jgi:hypothetical protein